MVWEALIGLLQYIVKGIALSRNFLKSKSPDLSALFAIDWPVSTKKLLNCSEISTGSSKIFSSTISFDGCGLFARLLGRID